MAQWRKVGQVPHTGTTCTAPGTCEQPELEMLWDAHENFVLLFDMAQRRIRSSPCNVMQRDAAHGPKWSQVVPCFSHDSHSVQLSSLVVMNRTS